MTTLEIINEAGKWYSYDRSTDLRSRVSKKDAEAMIKRYELKEQYEIPGICKVWAKW